MFLVDPFLQEIIVRRVNDDFILQEIIFRRVKFGFFLQEVEGGRVVIRSRLKVERDLRISPGLTGMKEIPAVFLTIKERRENKTMVSMVA